MAVLPLLLVATPAVTGAAAPGLTPTTDDPGAGHPGPAAPCEDREPHPPIVITEAHGPQGFTWTNPLTGEDGYRPGSGVAAGSGTADDPYVIAGYCIAGASPPFTLVGAAIELDGTEAHVVVADNRLAGLGDGVLVEDARNVTVRDNVVTRHSDDGVHVIRSSDVGVHGNELLGNGYAGVGLRLSHDVLVRGNRIVGNVVNGVHLNTASGNRIVNNTIGDNDLDGISLRFSSRNTIRGNDVTGSRWDGIRLLDDSNRNRVLNNTVVGNDAGLSVSTSSRNLLRGNLITGSAHEGLLISWGANNTVAGNRIASNDRGVRILDDSDGNHVHNNTIAGNEEGILLNARCRPGCTEAEGNRFAYNNLTRNHVGVEALGMVPGTVLRGNNIHNNTFDEGLDVDQTSTEPDAARNWWGCPSGPEAPACDSVDGKATYEPWLEDPVPEAGAP